MNLSLFDIVEKEKWHSMQDGFSKALGIHIQTVDSDAKPMPGDNKPSRFCIDIINAAHKKFKEDPYRECLKALIENIKASDKYSYQVCPLGDVFLYGIPIKIDDNITLAYAILGPVIAGRKKTRGEYVNIAKANAIPSDYLIERITMLKNLSFNGIESIVELFQEMAHYILQLNFDIKSLRKRFTVPGPLEDVIKDIYSPTYIDELLKALLHAALHTTRSSEGSIMILDTDKNELTVRFSRGLKSQIVKSARIKVGDGISGMVARDKMPLLINDDVNDWKIKERLKRPRIRSSIVYPLEAKNRIIGVMNINDTGSGQSFNSETFDLIDTLSSLTKVALSAFPK